MGDNSSAAHRETLEYDSRVLSVGNAYDTLAKSFGYQARNHLLESANVRNRCAESRPHCASSMLYI